MRRAKASIDESLKKLRTDYVDLMLIHQPFNDYYGTYRAMEEGVLKPARSAPSAVSNFMPDRFIDIANFTEIPPHGQSAGGALRSSRQRAFRPILKKYGAQLMAWSPLAQGKEWAVHKPRPHRDR